MCRTLYYTDWGDDAKVVRCNLDGSGRTVLLRGLQNPNSLAVDDAQGLLYVVDSQLKHRSSQPSAAHSSVLFTLSLNDDNVNWTVTNLSQINVLTLTFFITTPPVTSLVYPALLPADTFCHRFFFLIIPPPTLVAGGIIFYC